MARWPPGGVGVSLEVFSVGPVSKGLHVKEKNELLPACAFHDQGTVADGLLVAWLLVNRCRRASPGAGSGPGVRDRPRPLRTSSPARGAPSRARGWHVRRERHFSDVISR